MKVSLLIAGLRERDVHDRLLVPHPAGDGVHLLRRAHAQDPGGFQRVQVHRLQHVHHVRRLARFHPNLLQHGTERRAQDYIHVNHNQVPLVICKLQNLLNLGLCTLLAKKSWSKVA